MGRPLSSIIIDPQLTDAKAAEFLKQELDSAVEKNDIQKVQRILDDAFYSDYRIRPEWKHLKTAALNGNHALARVLVSWGATGTKAEIGDIALKNHGSAIIALNVLKGCGLFHDRIPEKTFAADKNVHPVDTAGVAFKVVNKTSGEVIDAQINKLPKEWLTVLKAVHDLQSPEAIIAGGALRDTFNQRAVRDVDIFLATRGWGWGHKSFISEVFEKAELQIHEQVVGETYDGITKRKFPAPNKSTMKALDYDGTHVCATKSWRIVAGPDKTEYNFIFVSKELAEILKNAAKSGYHPTDFLKAFDVGICCIGTDGKSVFMTETFKQDQKKKKIEVWYANDTSKDHLERIIKKYPDYEIGKEAQKILSAPPPKARYSFGS
jgi:hypothetical protein